MRYTTFRFGEVARLIAPFDTGDTDIEVELYDLASPASPIALTLSTVADGGVVEIGATGKFVWDSGNITTPPTVQTQYLVQFKRTGDGRIHDAKFVVGGFPDCAAIAQYNGRIWYSSSGVGGTDLATHGTPTNPSNSAADILNLATQLGVRAYGIVEGTLTIEAAHLNWGFLGVQGPASDALDVNGQDCDGSGFSSLRLTGTFGGVGINDLNGTDIVFDNAAGLKSGSNGAWVNCRFLGTNVCTGGVGTKFAVKDASSSIAGATIDVNGETVVEMRGVAGFFGFTNCTGGVIGLTLEGSTVSIGATNTGGIVDISGIHNLPVINGSSISAANFRNRTIPGGVFEQILTEHVTPGTSGEALARIFGNNQRSREFFADAAISGDRIVPINGVSHLEVEVRSEGAANFGAPAITFFIVFGYESAAVAGDAPSSNTVQAAAPTEVTFTAATYPT